VSAYFAMPSVAHTALCKAAPRLRSWVKAWVRQSLAGQLQELFEKRLDGQESSEVQRETAGSARRQSQLLIGNAAIAS